MQLAKVLIPLLNWLFVAYDAYIHIMQFLIEHASLCKAFVLFLYFGTL